jgi:cell wall-associated NlpC family hydrolase
MSKYLVSAILILSTVFNFGTAVASNSNKLTPSSEFSISWGSWNNTKLTKLISDSKSKKTTQSKIEFISSKFLGTSYVANTLTPFSENEKLVLNLKGLDCFTFIDYIEAIRASKDVGQIKDNLKKIRYKNADVSYLNRNHFFSDWLTNNKNIVKDVTKDIGKEKALSVTKKINQKSDGTNFIAGLAVVDREIVYIPSAEVSSDILKNIKSGDYIGMYANTEGLDVTHVGVFIRNSKGTFFRHASNKKGVNKVIDSNFLEYIKSKPGIIIYRPV